MFNRAERRHHLNRKKIKAKKIYKHEPEKLANNLKKCSCFMCGNPRKFLNRKTLQEIVHEENFLNCE